MYQLDANNFTMIFSHKWPLHVSDIYIAKLFASSWYIFLTYIYEARSHLHQICMCCIVSLYSKFAHYQ